MMAFKDDLDAYAEGLMAQGFWALQIHRFNAWRRTCSNVFIRKSLGVVARILSKMSQIFFGIYIGPNAIIGKRLVIQHFGCVIIHSDAVIGDDCILRPGVVIGMKRKEQPRAVPLLQDRVDVGAGAKILGAVTIGNDALIGANAVVTQDVPEGACAVGIPAIIKKKKSFAARHDKHKI